MDYKEALAAIAKLEGGTEAAKVLEVEIERINKERFETIGEIRNKSKRLGELEKTLEGLIKDVDGSDTSEKINNLTIQVTQQRTELETLRTQLGEATTKAGQLESEKQESDRLLQTERRRLQIRDAASVAQANPRVLETLMALDSFKDAALEIGTTEDNQQVAYVVKGETKKPLRDYAQESVPDFVYSLFPSTTQPQPEKPSPTPLPGGSPNGGTPKTTTVGDFLSAAGFDGGVKKA